MAGATRPTKELMSKLGTPLYAKVGTSGYCGDLLPLGTPIATSLPDRQALVNLRPEDLDNINSLGFVRLSLTMGVAASVVGAQLMRVNARYARADAYNQAGVAQII